MISDFEWLRVRPTPSADSSTLQTSSTTPPRPSDRNIVQVPHHDLRPDVLKDAVDSQAEEERAQGIPLLDPSQEEMTYSPKKRSESAE